MGQHIGKILFGIVLILGVVSGFVYLAGKAAPRADINNPQTCWWEGETPNLKQVCIGEDPDVTNQNEQYDKFYEECVGYGGKPEDCATGAACYLIGKGYTYDVSCPTDAPVSSINPPPNNDSGSGDTGGSGGGGSGPTDTGNTFNLNPGGISGVTSQQATTQSNSSSSSNVRSSGIGASSGSAGSSVGQTQPSSVGGGVSSTGTSGASGTSGSTSSGGGVGSSGISAGSVVESHRPSVWSRIVDFFTNLFSFGD